MSLLLYGMTFVAGAATGFGLMLLLGLALARAVEE